MAAIIQQHYFMRTDINSKLKLGQLSIRYYCPESEVDLASLTRFEKVYTKIVETPNEGAADAALDNEAVRVIKKMPRWEAGKMWNTKVNVRCLLPIAVRL